ncbi:hypothetical protein QBC33DRAFT_563577 [Phialemonium atrogriseum]|uniref:CFEM domain-containing protein n=1 Tax=Phialemonium atrogriseum TaxID=1093897 RepID=A0AAJ0BSI2_9PEZI|nr:uncharacterized protein QBC33DRAFT_563577 [Phialemonium atrogriseum]KAK1762588.1 hypothetical protein QBC33DRAFT_563577 [Phialemonium atrogriseum]
MLLLQHSPVSLLALLLAVSQIAAGEDLSSLPDCGQTCVSDVMGDPTLLGCGSGATACMCANPAFQFGIHDCVVARCPPDAIATVTNFAIALCATAVSTPPPASTPLVSDAAAVPATSAPVASPSTPSTPLPISTSVAPATPTAAASTPSSDPAPASSTAPTEQPITTTAAAATTESTAAAATTTSEASPTTATATPSSTAAASAPLSTGTKIGVGVGAAAAAAGIIAAAVFVLVRRRRRQADQSDGYLRQIQISQPMAGSGRSFAGGSGDGGESFDGGSHHGVAMSRYETGLSELEARSRRYEDMPPREKPRYIV